MTERSGQSVLRVAVIGCGPVGRLHADGVAASQRGRLVAACDLDINRADRIAGRFGAVAYEHLHAVLAQQKPDVVTVATPDDLHTNVCLEAIHAGCHVFCEKPLCTSVREARDVVGAAQRNNVFLGVNYNRRFGFGYRKAHELFSEGRIGNIERMCIDVTDGSPRKPHVPATFMLTSLLSHHFDLVRWFCGEIQRVSAQLKATKGRNYYDSAEIHCYFAGGARATITARYRDDQLQTFERAVILGSLASLVVDNVTNGVSLIDRDHPSESYQSECGADAFGGTIRDHVTKFVNEIALGRSPPVTGLDGQRGLELIEAAVQSHQGATISDVHYDGND